LVRRINFELNFDQISMKQLPVGMDRKYVPRLLFSAKSRKILIDLQSVKLVKKQALI